MSQPILPYDTHDLILSHLSLSPTPPLALPGSLSSSQESAINRSALCTYALASRASKTAAYPHIFSSVVLEVTLFPKRTLAHALERISQFAQILSWTNKFNGTSIARCIKSFTLIVNLPPLVHKAKLQAFLQDVSLGVIFDALHGPDHGVESFSYIVGTPELLLAYPDITPKTRRSFENLLRSPNLKHVQLDGISGVPRTLLCGTNVRNAEFYSTHLELAHSQDAPNILHQWQPTILESIGLDAAFPLVSPLVHHGGDEDLLDELVFKEVKEIYCRLTSLTSIADMIDMATRAVGSLRNFYIQISDPGSSLSTPPTLHNSHTSEGYRFHLLRHLSSLRISIISSVSLDQPNSAYPFCHILEQSTFHNTLEEIKFDITTHHIHHTWGSDSATLSSATLINRADWLEVNTLLGHAKFSHVGKISITIKYYVTVEPNARVLFDSAVFGEKAREELESVLSIFTVIPNILGPRRQGSIRVKVNMHDLEKDDNIVPYRKGFVMRCGGRRSWSIPLYGDA